VALTAGANVPDSIGYLDPTAASQLGMEGSTLLAVRPDGYVSLAAQEGDLRDADAYLANLAKPTKASAN